MGGWGEGGRGGKRREKKKKLEKKKRRLKKKKTAAVVESRRKKKLSFSFLFLSPSPGASDSKTFSALPAGLRLLLDREQEVAAGRGGGAEGACFC